MKCVKLKGDVHVLDKVHDINTSWQQCVYSMLAEEYDLNVLSLMNNNCVQAEVFQMPALNKHK
jgi:hypothetical protein